MTEARHAPAPDRDPHAPDPKHAPPDPKTKRGGKPAADNQGAQIAKPPAAAPKVMNPSYVNAGLFLDKYFRQHGQLADLMGDAASTGLAEFKTRTSHDYNKSSHLLMELFKVAIAIVPAGSVLKAAFDELRTGSKLFGLASTIKAVSSLQEAGEHAHSVKEAIEPVKKLYEAGEATTAVGESHHEMSEGRRQGDFEIKAMEDLTQLKGTEIAALWDSENFIDNLLLPLQFSSEQIDLFDMTRRMLGALPEARSLAADMKEVARAFEVNLYFQFYLEDGAVTYVRTEREDVTIQEFRGMPPAVVERLRETNNLDRVLAHPKLKHEHHVHRFEGMKV